MKSLKIVLIILSFFFVQQSVSQQISDKRVKKADALYEAGEYFAAIEKYEKAVNKLSNKSEKAVVSYRIAECYMLIKNPKGASKWYDRAIRYKYPDTQIYFKLADSYKMRQDYDKALETYKLYQELVPDDYKVQNEIKMCEEIKKWIQTPTRHQVKAFTLFNSKESDFSPAYARDDYSVVFFTSTREEAIGEEKSGISGSGFADIFRTRCDRKGNWSIPVPLNPEINTTFDEGTPVLTSSYNTMYFSRCKMEKRGAYGCKIFSAQLSGDKWDNVLELEIVTDSSITVAHPAITDDELTLYFVSDTAMKGGIGGKDIWFSHRSSKSDKWGKPQNIGSGINTTADEMFPYVFNKNTLYFASNGHPGMGGLDIFKAVKDEESGTWTIENMKYPINSYTDDFGITFEADGQRGYFASMRDGDKGGDDIYWFELPPLKFTLTGTVKDEITSKPIEDADVQIISSAGTSYTVKTNSAGFFKFTLKDNTDYVLVSTKEKYLKGKGKETTRGLTESKDLQMEIFMIPIRDNVAIELPNIEYDLDKATLRDISMVALDKLVETLTDNPKIVIELAAHTDYRGEDSYNEGLSQRRAQSVVNYLVSKGINKMRLVPKGYGETKPVTINQKTAALYAYFKEGEVLTPVFIDNLKEAEQRETAHQLNRRTEFSILSTDFEENRKP